MTKNSRRSASAAASIGAALLAVSALAIGGITARPDSAGAAVTTRITVDFTAPTVPSPARSFGFTFSTFGVEGGPIASSAADVASLENLGAGTVRLHLEPGPNGTVISGADGGDTSISGDRWIDLVEELGAEPIVIVNADRADALRVLDYLNANGHRVRRFIIGNEMDANSKSNLSPQQYTATFKSIAAAMRQVTPGLEIGGPAPAYFDTGLMQTFIDGAVKNAAPAERASFIDYHAYGAGNGVNATMAQSTQYAAQIDRLRGMIGDPTVGIQVGEYNMNWGNESQNNTHFASVWGANALGTIIASGGTALLYADKNNAMGLVGVGGAPKASYVGMRMFTGGADASGPRHFGTTVVRSSSSSADVRVYASANPGNIVVVNSGGATAATIALTGAASGTVDHWQSAGAANSVNLPALVSSAGFSGSSIRADLPAMSISTFVVKPSAGGVTPTPTATATSSPAPPAPGLVPGLTDPGWKARGSATLKSNTGTLTTAAQRFAAGAIYYDKPVASADLHLSFDAVMNGGGKGADGMTVALLDPTSTARVGSMGGGLGFAGLDGTAVVLDTFDNTTNSVGRLLGIADSSPGEDISYRASTKAVPDLRRTHHYDVVVAGSTLTVSIDGVVRLTSQVELPETVIIGFTAGTGSTTDLHRMWNVRATS